MNDKQYQLVIFDWDGTLMDSQAHIVNSLQHAMTLVGEPLLSNKETAAVIGLSLQEAAKQLMPENWHLHYDEFAQAYRSHYLAGQSNSQLFEKAEDTLQSLKEQGYWLAVATGKSSDGLKSALEHSGLGEYFLATRCADQCHSKPHPQMLEELLDEFGLEANHAVMIGDSIYDIQMAKNANVDAVAVSYGVHDERPLLDAGADGLIHNIEDILHWLPKKDH